MKSLQTRILFWAGICLLITTGAIVTYSAFYLHKATEENAKEKTIAIAKAYAGEIQAEMEHALIAARTIAQIFASAKQEGSEGTMDRNQVNFILKMALEDNTQFASTYTCWEPDAFDKMDTWYVGNIGHDKTGRFIPRLSRDEKGKIKQEPLVDYDKKGPGNYYQIPKKTKLESIIDPHFSMVQGKKTLITSLVVPILVEGLFYGIAGIDLNLDFIQKLADEMDADTYGKLSFISNKGTLVGVTGQPEMVGKPIDELLKNFESEGKLARIQQGERMIDYSKDRLAIFVPVKSGKTTTPWSVNVFAPWEKIMAKATQLMWNQILLGGLCALSAIILLWFVARSISGPIEKAIKGLNDGAEQITNASSQISSASRSLAEGSSSQAAAVEETSSSMEEMSSMIRQNAGHAASADNLVKETNKVIGEAIESMAVLAKSMKEIAKASEDTQKIVKTIDEIAFQTNLLALNAAVEAARAGDAGSGFAVVADEVRNLAMRAASAAKDTTELIDSTVKKINVGNKLGIKTNEAFSNVVEQASKLGELVGEIAAGSSEQAQGIEQVNKAITEMDQVIQKNAASAEENASASEQMSAQAEYINGIIGELAALVGGGTVGTENVLRGMYKKVRNAISRIGLSANNNHIIRRLKPKK